MKLLILSCTQKVQHRLKPYQQFLTFLVVGVINTIFSYSLFSLLHYVGLHYTIAVFLSTCVGVLFNFKTTGRLVFKNKANHLLGYFIGVYVLLYILTIILMKVFMSLLGVNAYIAYGITIFIMPILSYLLNKHYVFA